ncbi:MAG: glycosyltransferase family 2 protein [Planctomycetota bacterium]|jgi:glycosyltransferase involved in cell wall biosynthesis
MSPPFKTLLVLPAFNEQEALPKTIASLQQLPPGFEILIVNDGSKDRTRAVAEELAQTSRLPCFVLTLPINSGIGVAVQTGYRFAAARNEYRYVIQFDADGQHPADALPELVACCERGSFDLCVGSRFLGPANGGFQSTPVRRLGIRFFCWWIGLLSGVRVTDPTSGLRCAGVNAWRRFAEFYPEDYPEPESLFWCARNGLRIVETPVAMLERQGGVSSIRANRAVYYAVKVALAILFDRLRRSENLSESLS